MSFTDLYGSGKQARRLGHFSALVNTALINGPLTPREEILLLRFAKKFDITELQYNEILKNPKKYPIHPPNTAVNRLKQMHDLFSIVFADYEMDEDEALLVKRYATAIGFSDEEANRIIKRSIEIYTGGLDFYDFEYLLNKK